MDFASVCRVCGRELGEPLVAGIEDWEYGFPGSFSYRPCQACQAIQLHPFPSLEDLKEAYRVDYHGYAEPGRKGLIYRMLYALVERRIMKGLKSRVRETDRVLDVGCGIGLFLDKLRSLGLTRLEGLDFSDRAVQAVRDKGIACTQGVFLELPDEPGSRDMIVMNNYLEHTLDPAAELAKARLLLRPGGLLMGEVPNFASLDRMLFGRHWGGNHVPRHTFQFTPDSLRAFMARAGFRDVRLSFPLNTSHFALSVQNLLASGAAGRAALTHGRAWYYTPLMLALAPVNAPCVLLGATGFMRFEAVA